MTSGENFLSCAGLVEKNIEKYAMQTEEAAAPLSESEYLTLEQTLCESAMGQRFLDEYLRRHRTSETSSILSAIERLEKNMNRQRKVPSLDRIRLDIADMHEAIERTKQEISNIKHEQSDSNRFTDASHELDGILIQTERATQEILAAAESIQESAWTMRESGADDNLCDAIDAKATEIFMACSFQDLTGQRTQKVVHVLRFLESRINHMINIWGIEDLEAEDLVVHEDARPDSHLLNGPQKDGLGVNQNDVDSMLGGAAGEEVFDLSEAALHEKEELGSVDLDDFDHERGEKLDEESIDSLFDGHDETADAAASSQEPMDEEALAALFDTPDTPTEDNADLSAAPEADDEKAFGEDETAEEAVADADMSEEMVAAAEVDADDAWESEAIKAEDDDKDDPLAGLSEGERQSLFS